MLWKDLIYLGLTCEREGGEREKGRMEGRRRGREGQKGRESEVIQSCQTLCNPMDCSPPDSSIHGIFQARVLEWVAISFSRGIFLMQGSNLGFPHCRQILYHLSHQGSPMLPTWPLIQMRVHSFILSLNKYLLASTLHGRDTSEQNR